MSTAIWCITKHGLGIGKRLHEGFPSAQFYVPRKFEDKAEFPAMFYDELLSKVIGKVFHDYDNHIFVISLGAVIRMVAPYLKDKKIDPAVVVVDDQARTAISALSGHVGGANEFTERVAKVLKCQAIITTASDTGKTIPVDILGKEFFWEIDDHSYVTPVSAAVVNEEPVAFVQECGESDWWNRPVPLPSHIKLFRSLDEIQNKDDFTAYLIVTDRLIDKEIESFKSKVVLYRPKTLVLGTGCNSNTPLEEVKEGIEETLRHAHLSIKSLRSFASIERKKEEPAYVALQKEWKIPFVFYSKEELNTLENLPNPSDVVKKFVGSPGVAEPAAMLAANNENLIVPKRKFANMTAAVSRVPFVDKKIEQEEESLFAIKKGRIYIVGAGPGNPDLMTVRGVELLRRADLVIFTGSLVPRRLLKHCSPACEIVDSKGLDLNQITDHLMSAANENKIVVRLHTGEPSIYGATMEQCDIFKKKGVPFEMVPGISSFQAAAAVLKTEFTIPEVSQTLIISRAAGRTPVPEKEELKLLGQHGSTIVLYLSVGLSQKVQEDLLTCYPADTPAAICYRVSWPDEKIIRCELGELEKTVERHAIKMHALIIVGPGLKSHGTQSRLYADDFTHRFRKANKSE